MLLNDTATGDRFHAQLAAHDKPPLTRRPVTTVQVNLGRLCNQACRHCHVDAGPDRTEMAGDDLLQRLLTVLDASPTVTTVDLTGGAPELNPRFRQLVTSLRARGLAVMVRCNLTVLQEPGQHDLVAFYAEQRLHVVASLPCYTEDNVDRQRGGGVFQRSIAALVALNAVGYGASQGAPAGDDALRLDLVFNPGGPSLPPEQSALEADYRVRLAADHGIRFDRLLSLANMPIHRFAEDLQRQGRLDEYCDTLARAFNPDALASVMCHDLVSVSWDGRLSDCDFNLMLELPLGRGSLNLYDIASFDELAGDPITTAGHCLGCTAGQGSSCGGALTDRPEQCEPSNARGTSNVSDPTNGSVERPA